MISSPGWPALTWEQREWRPQIPPELVSAGVRRRHQGAYECAVVPLIAERQVSVPGPVMAAAEEAAAEIARFDAESGAELAPFAAVLLRSESTSSSRIENLTAGAKAIALAELGAGDRRNAAEIVGNVETMKAAIALSDRLDADAILTMHRELLIHHAPTIAGVWRTEQVWIGGTSYGPHQASFVPPHHDHVPALVDDLVRFTRRTDVPAVVAASVAHAQFETIHPFADGNGRTGRAIVHAMLRSRGLTGSVTVPVSAGLLVNLPDYFGALDAYRSGDIAPIVTVFANAAFEATLNGRHLAADLRRAVDGWRERVRPRAGSGAAALPDLLVRQPVIDAATVARHLGIEPRNAGRVIAPFVDAGILTEFTGLQRNRMWQCREVLDALDAFAERVGRRG